MKIISSSHGPARPHIGSVGRAREHDPPADTDLSILIVRSSTSLSALPFPPFIFSKPKFAEFYQFMLDKKIQMGYIGVENWSTNERG